MADRRWALRLLIGSLAAKPPAPPGFARRACGGAGLAWSRVPRTLAPAGLRGGAGEALRHLMSRTRAEPGGPQLRPGQGSKADNRRGLSDDLAFVRCLRPRGLPALVGPGTTLCRPRRTAQVTVPPIPGSGPSGQQGGRRTLADFESIPSLWKPREVASRM